MHVYETVEYQSPQVATLDAGTGKRRREITYPLDLLSWIDIEMHVEERVEDYNDH